MKRGAKCVLAIIGVVAFIGIIAINADAQMPPSGWKYKRPISLSPAMTPVGILLLIGLISMVAIIALKKKRK